MKHILKLFIKLFASLLKQNKYALKYLYTDALRKETIEFLDYGYSETYPHIEKTSDLAKKFKFDSDTILDIGAANGYTAQLYRKYLPLAPIVIFEPLSQNHSSILKVVESNANMSLVPKALGNEVKKMTMNRTSRITSSSLLTISDSVDSEYMREALKESEVENIQLSKLDIECASINKIGIMKIDVQGFEIEVLKGAVDTLKKTSLVVVEVSNHDVYKGAPMYYDVDEFLRSQNFKLYDNCLTFKEKGRLREWDAIYINNNLL